VLEHELQKQILLKLIHEPELSFNALWAKQGESNKFAYHVNKLEETGLIHKNGTGCYKLTDEGRKLSAFIEGDTGSKAEFPTLTVVMVVKQDGKHLCQRRLKEPFYGVWGLVSGKINFGQNVFECAKRDLFEESGLLAEDWKLKAIETIKTFDNEKLLYHHYMFIVQTDKVSGVLKEKTHKAEHCWLPLDEYLKKERFPSEWADLIFKSDDCVLIEGERYMTDGKFTGSKTMKVVKF